MEAWNQQPAPAAQVTMKEFEELCQSIEQQRGRCDEVEAQLKGEKEKLQAMETKAMFLLKDLGLESYKSKSGTFYINHRVSVSMPKTPADRAAFFKYLQEQGVYEALITVNSNTLTSFYKSKQMEAVEAGKGLEFQVPGLEEPKIFETLSFRRSNK